MPAGDVPARAGRRPAFLLGPPAGLGVLVTIGVLTMSGAPAGAHPEGREFLVNQYAGMLLTADQVRVTTVLNTAEIVTTQDRRTVDADRDDTVSDGERARYARRTCAAVAADLHVRVGTTKLAWTVVPGEYRYEHGTGGLRSARLTCALSSPAPLSTPATVSIDNRHDLARPGWHELTARGDGVHLVEPLLPAHSVSDELRAYPPVEDLTLDVRRATLRIAPGPEPAVPAGAPSPGARDASARADLAAAAGWAQRRFDALAGAPLTPLLAILTVLAAVLLGAGHAALPGHGKTVLAAYLAGRQGRVRDALTIGASVTVGHTGAVLLAGTLISTGTAFAGHRILSTLGVISGLLVVAVGTAMLLGAARRRPAGATYHHGHDHSHDHSHGHAHRHDRAAGRLGLAGIGVAGGLVPSPSALVVLLASIGMGRAAFGVLLVLAYGLGMAGTLTAAGLLLIAVQRRLTGGPARLLTRIGTAVPAAWPLLTSALVILVGLLLATRAAVALA